jgi:nucleoside phosphorylase
MDTIGLSEFLAERASDEAWKAAEDAEPLAESRWAEVRLPGEPTTRAVEGGIRLNRVTYRPLTPDDLPALAGYWPDPENVQLVLAMFWFMLTELRGKGRYDSIRIQVKLRTPAPVLLLSPDQPDGPGQGQPVLAGEIAATFASLLPSQPGATALDYGDDGFGWAYEARADAPLVPRRLNTLVVLELPPGTASLDGVLDAEAQISRPGLSGFVSRKVTLFNRDVAFEVPFTDSPPPQPRASGRLGYRPRLSGHDLGKPGGGRRPRPGRLYDLGLIIPLREEFDCARRVFAFGPQQREDGSYLYPFSVPGSDLRGIAVVLYDMGAAISGVTAAGLLSRFDLPLLALMGIAGALDGDLRLGDAVVARAVDPYFHRAKARPDAAGDGFEFDSGGTAWRAGRDLVRFADNFRYRASDPGEFAGWQARGEERRKAAGLPGDGIYSRGRPDYLVAPVASGEIVSAAAGFSRWLRTHHRECAAIEMEAGGVAQAVFEHGAADMIIVRGISDFADERKSELDAAGGPAAAGHGAWREYAALNAADLLATLLRSPGFPWPE